MPRALLASLMIHVLLVLVTWNLDFVGEAPHDPGSTGPRQSKVVEMILVPEAEFGFDRPKTFTSVPDRHEVEAPPKNPDFLAAINSRAADLLDGGEANASPGADRRGELNQVAILRNEGGGSPGGMTTLQPIESHEDGQDGDDDQGAADRRGRPDDEPLDEGLVETGVDQGDQGDQQGVRRGETAGSPELADLPDPAPPSILNQNPGKTGDRGFTYDQQSISAGGNMIQFGEYSLNTVEWDFAPWLEQFKRDFLPHWIPPYAYRLGVIDGKTVLRLVIKPDGVIEALDVIEKYGHESLHDASRSALRATAPFAPLPRDFPEEHLVLELGLHYPAWQAAEMPTRPGGNNAERRRRPR